MWGQDYDYSGVYYIANGKQLEGSNKYYDKNDPSVNFYLCPAQYYYNPEGSGTDVVSETNNTGFPFLTTNKTNQGDNSSVFLPVCHLVPLYCQHTILL